MEGHEKEPKNSVDRRDFIGTAAVAGALLAACGSDTGTTRVKLGEPMEIGPAEAPDGQLLRAGLIGCGGRGSGAIINFLESGPNLEIVALADVFQDRIDRCRTALKEGKQGARHVLTRDVNTEIPDDKCFAGFDAYERLLEEDIDIVLIATPPHFRPAQFEAAVNARKHVFMEKPMAVDPVGCRKVLDTAEKAAALGLSVVTGTQRRHQHHYIEAYNRVMDGAIGEIRAARCYWNTGQLWYRERQEDWSDMEWMIRDWVNWCWLSGDHIVEQHVHNIDVVNWFTGSHPVQAVGMGGRQRRVTGDQYDFFSIDYELESGVHVMSMCRQIDGCANNVTETIVGSEGIAFLSSSEGRITAKTGEVIWEKDEEADLEVNSPYVQEHVNLVTAIRTDKQFNEAANTAISTLTAIMGRISAYTGQAVTWDEMMQSNLRLGPEAYELGPSDIEAVIPVPGGEGV